jgi:hypothetical protein
MVDAERFSLRRPMTAKARIGSSYAAVAANRQGAISPEELPVFE